MFVRWGIVILVLKTTSQLQRKSFFYRKELLKNFFGKVVDNEMRIWYIKGVASGDKL